MGPRLAEGNRKQGIRVWMITNEVSELRNDALLHSSYYRFLAFANDDRKMVERILLS
jgi:hypothetical protein